jgi:ABC-type amino acid transport substrate-binding protein
MEEEMTRSDLLKVASLVTGGAALALGLPSTAEAQDEIPRSAYLQAYVRGDGLPDLLVQAAAFQVPIVGTGDLQPLAPDPATGVPGFGYDVDFGQAVAGNNKRKNKGKNTSWCEITFTHGGLNGFPPVNAGGVDAIRLSGTVTAAADPANLGVPVAIHGSSGAPIEPEHPICLIKFFFGTLGPWNGRGLAFVNH